MFEKRARRTGDEKMQPHQEKVKWIESKRELEMLSRLHIPYPDLDAGAAFVFGSWDFIIVFFQQASHRVKICSGYSGASSNVDQTLGLGYP